MIGPVVGIVVPVRDGARFLAETLRSIQAQTFTDWCCVVVDDGSSDDTPAIAQRTVDEDGRFRLLRQDNAGTPAARNAGIAALPASVRLLSFVDGDDTLLPHALAVLHETLAEHPDAVGCYGLAEYMTGDGEPYALGVHPARQRDRRRLGRVGLTAMDADEPYTFSALIVSGTVWPSAVALHRREIVERVGRFDTDLRQVQDWDLYVRMSRHGAFVPVDRQVAWYRQHAANVTSRTERVAFYSLLVRRRAETSAQNSRAQRRAARRVMRRLAARWVVWSAESAGRALRFGNRNDVRSALTATGVFAGIATRGRVPEPTERIAHFVARYVMARHPQTEILTERPGR